MSASERTLPRACLVHHIEGRTRLRLPDHRGDGELFERLVDVLASTQGIEAVSANPVTGSLLVYHLLDGPTDLGRVGRERELFSVGEPEHKRVLSHRLSERVQQGIGDAERWIDRESRGEADLPGLAFVLLLFASFYQAIQGRALPAGVTLLNYALKMIPGLPGAGGGGGAEGAG